MYDTAESMRVEGAKELVRSLKGSLMMRCRELQYGIDSLPEGLIDSDRCEMWVRNSALMPCLTLVTYSESPSKRLGLQP